MYVNVYVPKSGGSVVPKSDVYKCSDPSSSFIVEMFGRMEGQPSGMHYIRGLGKLSTLLSP